MEWYALRVQSGVEDFAAKKILEVIDSFGLKDKVAEVFVPKQKQIVVNNNGEKVTKEKRLLPGYVLIHADLDNEVVAAITTLEEVKGVVRNGTLFIPIKQEEIDRLKSTPQAGKEGKFSVPLRVNDAVKITSGVFAGQVAKVSKIDEKKGRVEVLISMLGTEVPHVLSVEEVEKL